MMTDGEPNGGKDLFCEELRKVVKKENTPHTFRVQIMACTPDDSEVAWLNEVDRQFDEVDVTDDYYSELAQIAPTGQKFTRGDWLVKAMLGPISAMFDAWDEVEAWRGRNAEGRAFCTSPDWLGQHATHRAQVCHEEGATHSVVSQRAKVKRYHILRVKAGFTFCLACGKYCAQQEDGVKIKGYCTRVPDEAGLRALHNITDGRHPRWGTTAML